MNTDRPELGSALPPSPARLNKSTRCHRGNDTWPPGRRQHDREAAGLPVQTGRANVGPVVARKSHLPPYTLLGEGRNPESPEFPWVSGAPRSTVEHHGAQWSTKEHSGAPRSTVEHSGAPRSTVEHHGAHWSTMEHSGAPWSTVEHHGAQWSTMEHSGAPRSSPE
eukprot:gene17082-biopygen20340